MKLKITNIEYDSDRIDLPKELLLDTEFGENLAEIISDEVGQPVRNFSAEVINTEKDCFPKTSISTLTQLGVLRADVGPDPDFPELYISLEKPDGELQDVCVIGPGVDGKLRVYIFGDAKIVVEPPVD